MYFHSLLLLRRPCRRKLARRRASRCLGRTTACPASILAISSVLEPLLIAAAPRFMLLAGIPRIGDGFVFALWLNRWFFYGASSTGQLTIVFCPHPCLAALSPFQLLLAGMLTWRFLVRAIIA